MIDNLHTQDANLVGWLNLENVLFHSWWSILAILLAHIPLGMLPHIGNKLWALKSEKQRKRFVGYAFAFALILGMLGLGGIMARAIFGDALLQPGESTNYALAALFIEIFPTWLAAFLGIGILAAVMSTADGLVVSSSQILANDLYRCSYVPRFDKDLDAATVDRRVLLISRYATVGVMIICSLLAWALMDTNVALIVWIGSGGLMAAFAGPLVLGAVWKGVTKAGAYAGLIGGVTVFSITHSGFINPEWFTSPGLHSVAQWLQAESPNPWSCAAMGEIVSVVLTYLVSKRTQPLPQSHLRRLGFT